MTGDNQADEELKRRARRRSDVLDQIAELQEELKGFKAEDKADGFSEKALGQVIREMRRGAEFQEKQLTLELEVDTYRRACGLPRTVEEAQGLVREQAEAAPEPRAAKGRAKAAGEDE